MTKDLFPAPFTPSFVLSPRPLAGINPQSTETLRAVLKHNHEKWHIYFNERGFHKYVSFCILDLSSADNLLPSATPRTTHSRSGLSGRTQRLSKLRTITIAPTSSLQLNLRKKSPLRTSRIILVMASQYHLHLFSCLLNPELN
jgi:hypothetical protein